MKLSSAVIILGFIQAAAARRLGLFEGDPNADKPRDSYTKGPEPTKRPTSSPTQCEPETCVTNYDCPRICHQVDPYSPKQCVATPPTLSPVFSNTPAPTTHTCCEDPSPIPDRCEVGILLQEMDLLVTSDPKKSAQLTRAAFHDAGTFDQTAVPPEGGANGCLLTDPAMRLEPENAHLHEPLNSLQAVMDVWHAHPATCIKVSSADMLQFAIFFAVVRQSDPNIGILTPDKRDFIKDKFLWGRIDETQCDTTTAMNLPAFQTSANGIGGSGGIADRCGAAGEEIRKKMIDLNGFTAEEATVLIGAHTIGKIRHTFGPQGGVWVPGGDDNATPNGPKFDNEFFEFIINDVAAPNGNDANQFEANGPVPPPFDTIFPTWWKEVVPAHNHFDTDLTLAFPPVGAHPNYRPFSVNFANDNAVFIETFMLALDKMSTLGVTVNLFPATECEEPCGGAEAGIIDVDDITILFKKIGNATAYSEKIMRQVQVNREDEIRELTKPQAVRDNSDGTPPRV